MEETERTLNSSRPIRNIVLATIPLVLLVNSVSCAPGRMGSLPSLNPEDFGESIIARQKITISRGGRDFSFRSVVEVHPDRMVVIGFSPMSTRMFTIQIRKENVEIETSEDVPFPLRRYATDLQWMLWPNIPDRKGYSVEEKKKDSTWIRMIKKHEEIVGTVRAESRPPWKGDLFYRSKSGYTIRIKTILGQKLKK